jgi:hypothetical protein
VGLPKRTVGNIARNYMSHLPAVHLNRSLRGVQETASTKKKCSLRKIAKKLLYSSLAAKIRTKLGPPSTALYKLFSGTRK